MMLKLVTGRTLGQGIGKEYGKTSMKYMESVSVCELDESDLAKLGVNPGENVKISSSSGSVILKTVKSKDPSPGIVFIPYGPWANILIETGTGGTGMPQYKGIDVEVETSSEKVMALDELLKTFYGGKK